MSEIEIPEWWDHLQYFSPHEMYGIVKSFPRPDLMSEQLMRRADFARMLYDLPFSVTSSYRVGDPLAHGDGEALDIAVFDSFGRWNLFDAVKRAGFKRIGVYTRHIHVDVSEYLPKGLWAGVSEELEEVG